MTLYTPVQNLIMALKTDADTHAKARPLPVAALLDCVTLNNAKRVKRMGDNELALVARITEITRGDRGNLGQMTARQARRLKAKALADRKVVKLMDSTDVLAKEIASAWKREYTIEENKTQARNIMLGNR